MLDGFDDKANELGAKGVGELGICGAGAAVANAVFNATGVRVRDFPITDREAAALVEIERVEDAAVRHHEQAAVAGDRRLRRDAVARIEVLERLAGLALGDEQAGVRERVHEQVV